MLVRVSLGEKEVHDTKLELHAEMETRVEIERASAEHRAGFLAARTDTADLEKSLAKAEAALAAERERAAEQGQRRDSLLADVRAHLDRFEGAVGALEQNDSFDMLHLGVDKGLFEHALEHFANFERSLGAEEATVA